MGLKPREAGQYEIFTLLILLLTLEPSAYGVSLFSGYEQTYQHLMPSGGEFPGSVPKGVERINKTFLFSLHPRSFSELRLRYSPINRKSTGLYRVPGEPVTIRVESASGNTLDLRPFIRIGAHTDQLNSIPASQRKRVSVASHSMELEEGIQQDRDWTSGLIYLESNDVGADSFAVTIFGAVKAPWFKLGRDSLAQWKDEIRHYPAPWAELEGEHTILTLPSAMIRDLDDPIAVVTTYDQLVKDANALVGLSPDSSDPVDKAPDLPFRFVIDIQSCSDNRSHSGYPIVLWWLENGNPMLYLDPDAICNGYILRHELGHSYEPSTLAFEPPGAAQVFANLFIFAYQYNSGYWFLDTNWNNSGLFYYLPYLSYALDLMSFGLGEGYNRTIWNPDHNVMFSKKTALIIALVTSLTTEPITRLYQQFRRLPEEMLPSNQQAKTDYFFESLCENSGQDLSLLFKQWQVPVSPEAYQRVSEKAYRHPRWLYHDGL